MLVSARRCEANACATGALTTTLAHSASGAAVAGTPGSSNNWAASNGIAEALAGGGVCGRNAGATRPASAGPVKWWTANDKAGSGGGAGGAEQAASGSAMQSRRRNDMREGPANVPRQGAAVRLAAFSCGGGRTRGRVVAPRIRDRRVVVSELGATRRLLVAIHDPDSMARVLAAMDCRRQPRDREDPPSRRRQPAAAWGRRCEYLPGRPHPPRRLRARFDRAASGWPR